jgi:hypothetical protein
MGMKILRAAALFLAILIPSYAIAAGSTPAARDCCCPGCPLCNH